MLYERDLVISQISSFSINLNQISCGATILGGHAHGITESLFHFASPISVDITTVNMTPYVSLQTKLILGWNCRRSN